MNSTKDRITKIDIQFSIVAKMFCQTRKEFMHFSKIALCHKWYSSIICSFL